MNFIDKMVERFIKLNRRMKRWQRVVSVMAAVVVFATTYALVLPAITLDKDTATTQAGIEIAASENESDEAGTVFESEQEDAVAEEEPEEAEEPAAEEESEEAVVEEPVKEEDSSSESGSQEAEAAETVAPETETADESEQTETLSAEEAATYGTTEEAIAAVTGQTAEEIRLITEDTQLKYVGNDYVVYADFGKTAKLPEGVQLKVKEITKESDPEAYNAYYEKALSEMQDKYDENTTLSFAKFYDIAFVYEGVEIEPSGNVNVRIEYKKAVEIENTKTVDTIHFDKNDEKKVEVIDSDTEGTEKKVEAVEFKSDQFSVFGVVGVETIIVPFTASDGRTYEVTVIYGEDAGIPEGAGLEVSEVTEDSDTYSKYVEKAAEAIRSDADSLNFIKLLDIKIVDKNGNKVILDAPVDVQIRLMDKNIDENAQIVHFADGSEEGDVIDGINVNGETVRFETEGFSIYAVIGGPEPTARMKVNFHAYDENGDELITSMYIKNDDTPEELEMILFDPGVGKLNEGETFRGWTFDENYTVANATSVYDADENPDGAMTIQDLREWAQGKQAEGIVEDPMPEYDVYPMILKNYEIRYLDRFGIAIDTDSAYMLRDDTSAQYTINMAYTTNDDDYHFKGWITEEEDKITSPNPQPETVTIKVPSESDPDVYVDKDYLLYTNNTSIQLNGDITLNAHAPKGKWLIFHEMEKGATYIAPQFLEEGESPVMPADDDMRLLGYEFAGWYLDEAYTRPYNGTPIIEKTDVYAKWVPTTWAPYTVIIWKQGLDGKYAYQESFQLYGPVGTEVEALNSLSIVNNNDADYLQVNGQNESHGAVNRSYQTVHTTTGASPNIAHHYYYAGTTTNSDYVGFNCARIDYTEKDDSGNSVPVVVDAAGTKVVNAYYDRIEYSVKLYLLRRNGNNYYHATYRRNTATNRPEMEINNGNNGMQWEVGVNNYTNNDPRFPSNMQWEQRGNEYYSYVEVTAKYGEDISGQWPKYETLEDLGNYKFTSWYTMNAAGFYKGSGSGLDSFKGIITIMDEQILGDITTAEGANYLIGRYDQNIAEYTYEIWRETLEGEDYSGYETTERGGKTYYHDTEEDIYSRSSAKPSGAHSPTYRGFIYRDDLDVRPADPTGNGHYGQHYTIEFYHDRVVNPIIFRDGTYFDGNGNRLNGYSNRSADVETEDIPFEEDVSSYNKGGENYNDTYQPAYPGFVLEGWYTDDACTTPYEFDKMPDSSITVYAKWVQVEYRVFLHPEVPSGKTVFWGSDEQNMNFRIAYGGKVSLPEGILVNPTDPDVLDDSYEFAGWYRDPEYHMPYDGDAYVLNDGITVPYDKSEMTDEMNEYGEITGGGPSGSGWNSDAIYYDENTGTWVERDRWWITRKLDLYGKWIKKMEAGTGIQVIYDPNGGSDEVHDDTLYKDGTNAVAQSAPITTPTVEVEGEQVSSVFLYWVIQKWDEEKQDFVDFDHMKFVYPGDLFDIDYENARTVETIVIDPVTGEETIKTEYFIQLRAEYENPEKETPTHIWWYSNFGDNEVIKLNDTDEEQDVENVKINEAVFIKPEDTFTRPGYTFLGWARVNSTDESGVPIEGHPELHPELGEEDLFLKYVEASEGTSAHFEALNSSNEWVPVTQVAADERYPYHDLYAVWKPDYYKVTIKKVVNGFPADAAETRTYTVSYSYDDVTGTKDLINYNNIAERIQTIGEQVPYEAVVKVEETNEPEFQVEYSAVRTTTDTGAPVNPPVEVSEEQGGGFKILGDTEITVTNTRTKIPVKVIKADQSGRALENAEFKFIGTNFDGGQGGTYTSAIKEGGSEAIIVESDAVAVGTYILSETNEPAGYYALDGNITITVAISDTQTFDANVTVAYEGEIGSVRVERVSVDHPEQGWVVTITDDEGVLLPMTGGPGTLLYTLSGLILMIASALMCGFRLRRRERRFN